MKHLSLLLLFLLPVAGSAQPRKARLPFHLYKRVEAERMINNIRDLASTAFEGRELGTDGNDKAVDWVSFKLEQTGVAPLFGGSYVQDFPITRYDLGASNYVLLGNDSLKLYQDFLPAYYTTDAHIGAHVLYAGFGLYETDGRPFKDKIVVMHGLTRKHLLELKYLNPDTVSFTGLAYPLFFDQARWAERQGAAAVIFVPEPGDFAIPFENGAVYQYSRVIKLPPKARKDMRHAPSPYVTRDRLNIAVVYATYEAGLRIMQVTGASFKTLADNARKGLIPFDQILQRNVLLGTQLKPVERRFATNIGGILHGKFGSPYLLIAANLDQEGQHPTLGFPYLGANGNATGIAVMLEVASIFQKEKDQPEYGIVFLIHNGAERDLAGLRDFMSRNSAITRKLGGVLLLNNLAAGPVMDSVSVFLRSVRKGTRFNEEAERTVTDYGYTPVIRPQTGFHDVRNVLPFSDARIPVIEMSSGLNSLENRISDVPDRLNYVKMYRMTQFTLELVWRYNYIRNSSLLQDAR